MKRFWEIFRIIFGSGEFFEIWEFLRFFGIILKKIEREANIGGAYAPFVYNKPSLCVICIQHASSRLPVSRKVGSREGMEKIGSERSPQHVYI